jgi:hypothetical protein
MDKSHNFIAAYTPRKAGLGNLGGRPVSEVNQQIEYMDGLGRPVQNVLTRASVSGRDIVTPFAYDANERESKKYLAYSDTSALKGTFKPSVLSRQAAFYNSPAGWGAPGIVQISTGNAPFSEILFEESPMARVLEQAAPGASWKMGGHTISLSSGTNGSSDVRHWVLSGTGAVGTAYYTMGKLFKSVVTDENGHDAIEFKDSEGRLIEKRVEGPASTWLVTSYVYDDYGNLAFVLPPAVTATSFNDSSPDYADYIYAYQYDDRNRLVAKKIPGGRLEEPGLQ